MTIKFNNTEFNNTKFDSTEFDSADIEITEFGVGLQMEASQLHMVPVDKDVKHTLMTMMEETCRKISNRDIGEILDEYDPSEKYGDQDSVILRMTDPLAEQLYNFHQAHLDIGSLDLNENDQTEAISFYFTRFKDKKGDCITAIRRAQYFKGTLNKKGRIVRLVDDTLKLYTRNIFTLDKSYDFFATSNYVYILNPNNFEFILKLKDLIKGAIPDNIRHIKKDLPFVMFDNIQDYAEKHMRAAQYLASIYKKGHTEKVDKSELKRECREQGINITEENGTLKVSPKNELAFLELLNRRLYTVKLSKNGPEYYKALSRKGRNL